MILLLKKSYLSSICLQNYSREENVIILSKLNQSREWGYLWVLSFPLKPVEVQQESVYLLPFLSPNI